jgi:hypothetical protein
MLQQIQPYIVAQEMKTSYGNNNMPQNPWKGPNSYISDTSSYVYKMFDLYFFVLLLVNPVIKLLSDGHIL